MVFEYWHENRIFVITWNHSQKWKKEATKWFVENTCQQC